MGYDDDRPGMMRVHIAQQRADALCKAYTRDWIRHNAKRHGISTALSKRDMAFYLVQHPANLLAPGYDKAAER